MRSGAAQKHEPCDSRSMAAIRFERDLDAHRMADQDGAIDEGVVENARHIVGEILDRDARRILRRGGAAVTSIVRVNREPLGQVWAQVAPDITVATDSIAQQHWCQCCSLSPRLVEDWAAILRDGVRPLGPRRQAISFSSSSPGN